MLSSAPMLSFFARWRVWLPLAVLLVALASTLALGGDRGYLYTWRGIHDEMTAKNMAVAGNMSAEHNFRMATRIRRDEDGGFRYSSYGRFPVGGYALIKLAILPFEGGLAAKLLAARALMLLMFCGAALFAYLALVRIAGSRWIALAAVLLALSSLYPLYYADAVSGETAMDMFGAMLVFHGMAVFVQEGRFWQLVIKTCAALLLGWHAYALIMPFALLGFGGEAFALVRSALASGGGIRAALAALPALARSRFMALAAVAVLFGSALLAFNLAGEYAAYGGRRGFDNLPSVNSMTDRLGLTADSLENNPDWNIGVFLRRQFERAGVASAPHAVAGLAADERYAPPLGPPSPTSLRWAAWGVAATVAALAAALTLIPRRLRLPMASAVLMGLCWGLTARHSTFVSYHAHEGLFYVGLPLALWSGALIGARRLLGERLGGALAVGIAAIAAPVFALSALYAAQIRDDPDSAELSKDVMADMSAVREIASGKRLAISPDARRLGFDSGYATHLYLMGIYWEYAKPDSLRARAADYAVSRYRNEGLGLTPDNRRFFLYEGADLAELHGAERRRIESSPPDADAVFDVYLDEGALAYLKSPCVWEEDADDGHRFFLSVLPVGEDKYRDGGHYLFSRWGMAFDDACMMTLDLPDYPIAAVRTGQLAPEGGRLWEVAIFPPPSAETLAAYESEYQAVADGEPAARAGFDLYLDPDGETLSYLKAPCSEDDARGRFFLSVHPASVADLPAERRALGHESLNFDFVPPHGVVFNGKCMATRQLPDYEIAKIETGQWIPGGERLWDTTVEVGD